MAQLQLVLIAALLQFGDFAKAEWHQGPNSKWGFFGETLAKEFFQQVDRAQEIHDTTTDLAIILLEHQVSTELKKFHELSDAIEFLNTSVVEAPILVQTVYNMTVAAGEYIFTKKLELDDKEKELASLSNQLHQTRLTLAAMKFTASDLEFEIINKRQLFQRQEKYITELKDEIKTRDARLLQYNFTLTAINELEEALQQKNKTLEEVKEMKEQYDVLVQAKNSTQEKLKKQEADIEELERQYNQVWIMIGESTWKLSPTELAMAAFVMVAIMIITVLLLTCSCLACGGHCGQCCKYQKVPYN